MSSYRIWAPDVTTATSRNATIMTGAEVLSLEWDHRSDRLVSDTIVFKFRLQLCLWLVRWFVEEYLIAAMLEKIILVRHLQMGLTFV